MKTKQHQAARAQLYAQGEPGGDGRSLVRLVELAEQEAQRQSLPFSEAARRVADALKARPGLALFKGGAAGFASEVHEQTYWGEGGRFVAASESARASVPAGAAEANPNALLAQMIRARQNAKGRPAGPEIKRYPLMGREGALQAFLAASSRAPGADASGLASVESLAMLRSDMSQLFDAGQAEEHEDGPSWPHKKEAKWTDSEKDAMFRMRHLQRMTNQAIADKVGCETHQRVVQLIGAKDEWKNRDGFKSNPWRPSAELLKSCGLASQPLQEVASVLSSTGRKAA